jgi:hypothetical protein
MNELKATRFLHKCFVAFLLFQSMKQIPSEQFASCYNFYNDKLNVLELAVSLSTPPTRTEIFFTNRSEG